MQAGRLQLVLINRDPAAAAVIALCLLRGVIEGDRVRRWEQTGPSWHAMNDAVDPTRVRPQERDTAVRSASEVWFTARPASLYVPTCPLAGAGP